MDVNVIIRNAPFMLGGLVLSFQLAALAITGGLLLGMALALARLSSRWLFYYPATLYIHFFRGLPLILVIFSFFAANNISTMTAHDLHIWDSVFRRFYVAKHPDKWP